MLGRVALVPQVFLKIVDMVTQVPFRMLFIWIETPAGPEFFLSVSRGETGGHFRGEWGPDSARMNRGETGGRSARRGIAAEWGPAGKATPETGGRTPAA